MKSQTSVAGSIDREPPRCPKCNRRVFKLIVERREEFEWDGFNYESEVAVETSIAKGCKHVVRQDML